MVRVPDRVQLFVRHALQSMAQVKQLVGFNNEGGVFRAGDNGIMAHGHVQLVPNQSSSHFSGEKKAACRITGAAFSSWVVCSVCGCLLRLSACGGFPTKGVNRE